MIKLKIDKKIFNPIYYDKAFKNNKRYQCYYGGSSSGKSYAVLGQRTILDILQGHRNYLIVRQTQNTIKRSAFNEVVKAIQFFKLSEHFQINRSDLIITCTLNNKQILFAGLDDTEKIKSITPIDGVITDVIIEEATETDYKAYKQLDKRLRGQSKVPKRITFIFNPVLKEHWLYKEFFIGLWDDSKQYVENENCSILKTTYKDNKYLTQDDIDALENETDQYYYDVYTLGNWGVLGALIFTNWRTEDLTELIPTFDNNKNGVDWGYSTDPFAFIRSHIDLTRKKLYIYKGFYMYEASNDDSAARVKPEAHNEQVICDSAEPKSIDDFKKLGIKARPAKKGKGSIEHGIKFLKSLDIIIDSSLKDVISEFSRYKWKEDRNGNVLSVPVDRDNHLIDALRYSLEDVNKGVTGWGWQKKGRGN